MGTTNAQLCIYEVLDGILFLNRIYANVNESVFSETFLKCSEYVKIGAKLFVFHVLLCAVTICLKNQKTLSVGFFNDNISLRSKANVIIGFSIQRFSQHN